MRAPNENERTNKSKETKLAERANAANPRSKRRRQRIATHCRGKKGSTCCQGKASCVRLVRHENIPEIPVSDWSLMRIYPCLLCPIGPSWDYTRASWAKRPVALRLTQTATVARHSLFDPFRRSTPAS
eukprot:1885232-Pyramimonas_sp.AAC.1